jgi:hypothetical protein
MATGLWNSGEHHLIWGPGLKLLCAIYSVFHKKYSHEVGYSLEECYFCFQGLSGLTVAQSHFSYVKMCVETWVNIPHYWATPVTLCAFYRLGTTGSRPSACSLVWPWPVAWAWHHRHEFKVWGCHSLSVQCWASYITSVSHKFQVRDVDNYRLYFMAWLWRLN